MPKPLIAKRGSQSSGLVWALLSPLFLGTIPIFAKLAFAAGVDIFSVVAIRTLSAAIILWLTALIFGRKIIYSSLPAIISSFVAGGINGLGSFFFYASLTRIDASLGQLINITYLIFVTLLLRLIGHKISIITIIRIVLAFLSIYLLTVGGIGEPDWLGISLMLIAAIAYAIQLVLGQRIMYDIPAPTMTIYAMTGMAVVVTIPWLVTAPRIADINANGWQAVLLMGLATALSRLTLFLGVKKLGSIQTALFGVTEVIITIVLAALLLHERFTMLQSLGGIMLIFSILLVRFERNVPKFVDWWRVLWNRDLKNKS